MKIQDFPLDWGGRKCDWELSPKRCQYLCLLHFLNNKCQDFFKKRWVVSTLLFFMNLHIFHRIDIFYTKICDSKLKLYPSCNNQLNINFIKLIKSLLVHKKKLSRKIASSIYHLLRIYFLKLYKFLYYLLIG